MAIGYDTTTSAQTLRFWQSPPGKPYWREDGFGPYAGSWPTYSVITTYVPNALGAKQRAGVSDSTLFLMSGAELRESNLVESIPSAARFATACRGDARGCWVRFASAPLHPFFVLVEETGGNCGDQIRIFGHSIDYDSPHVGESAFQDHTFSEVFTRGCINSPRLADIDRDGFPELIVNEMIACDRSRADSKYRYRIIKLVKDTFEVVGDLDEDKVKALCHSKKL